MWSLLSPQPPLGFFSFNFFLNVVFTNCKLIRECGFSNFYFIYASGKDSKKVLCTNHQKLSSRGGWLIPFLETFHYLPFRKHVGFRWLNDRFDFIKTSIWITVCFFVVDPTENSFLASGNNKPNILFTIHQYEKLWGLLTWRPGTFPWDNDERYAVETSPSCNHRTININLNYTFYRTRRFQIKVFVLGQKL